MKCPYCEKDLPGVLCEACGSTTPEGGDFCMACGASLSEEMNGVGVDDSGFELDDRIPCSDGNCIGIIVDGRCTECGKKSKSKKK